MSILKLRESEFNPIAVGNIVRRGDYMTSTVIDQTRVGNPIFGDIIESRGKYLVVPADRRLPIAERDTFDECMSFIRRVVEE